MTSVINPVPQAQGIEADIPVWMKVDWPPEIQHGIYKDWGKYYSRKHRGNIAMQYFDEALKLDPDDYNALYHRSQNKRAIGQSEGALADSLEAQRILKVYNTNKFPINLETCDALFQLNRFEDTKAELHNSSRLFSGNRTQFFETRLTVVDETIKDTCGKGLSPFILANEKTIKHVKELVNAQMKVDDRPLWKKLREQGKCDILSVLEQEEELISPLEKARRKRAFDVCNQVYENNSWLDVVFLKNLRKNPNLQLGQSANSWRLRKFTEERYEIIRKYLSMIYARSPMYYVRHMQHMSPKFREAILFRIQHQTRRNMLSILRNIREYKAKKDLPKLASYIEEVMGDYVVLKTLRIMPWKVEFLNEVYNNLALALTEQYYIPKDFKGVDRNALLFLLHHTLDKSKDPPAFVFGDRSTYVKTEVPAKSSSRRLMTRLERRLFFAKHSIEKCYLLHQMANIHLESFRYNECCFVARKAIEESKECNSLIWNLLSNIMIIKSNAAIGKIEAARNALGNALQLSESLKSPQLEQFFDLCLALNERLSLKGSSIASAKRESKMSLSSHNSG
ncbi:hypothetical protein KR222_005353 [Zaprionus bogoriensis]|nr:hypothetical protein KR222_005353 [Zaprionus bogoriensis]